MKFIDITATSQRLREMRVEQDLKATYVAARLCVSPGAVSRWEQGKCLPGIDRLVNLADIYGCRVEDLLVIREG